MLAFVHSALPDAFLDHGGRNLRSCRTCWPDWEGPKITDDETDLAGWVEVHGCGCTFNLTTGRDENHYCAPCRILEVTPSGNLKVRIQYGPDYPEHCRRLNGQILILTAIDVWPPVALLWARYYEARLAAAIEEGKTCDCGGLPAHCYGNGFECQPCRTKRLASYKPAKKAKKSPKKKSSNAPKTKPSTGKRIP